MKKRGREAIERRRGSETYNMERELTAVAAKLYIKELFCLA